MDISSSRIFIYCPVDIVEESFPRFASTLSPSLEPATHDSLSWTPPVIPLLEPRSSPPLPCLLVSPSSCPSTSPPLPPSSSPRNLHSMVTRAKANIHKPLHNVNLIAILSSFDDALPEEPRIAL